eukprot:7693337-Karenia_brevis.AAC.1
MRGLLRSAQHDHALGQEEASASGEVPVVSVAGVAPPDVEPAAAAVDQPLPDGPLPSNLPAVEPAAVAVDEPEPDEPGNPP